MDEIATGKSKVWRSNREPKETRSEVVRHEEN
jgi:hypothetical protein